MEKKIHRLSSINIDKMIAFCQKCDKDVQIYKRGLHKDGIRQRYACKKVGLDWVKKPSRRPKPGEHWLSNPDENDLSAFCYGCQIRVKYVKRGLDEKGDTRFVCKNANDKHQKTFRSRHPLKSKEYTIKRKYGLTLDEYNNLLKNGCEVCGVLNNLAIDHDHACCPGKITCGNCIRGVLCRPHNTAIGLFDDNIDLLQKAIDYLSSG